MVEVQGFLRQRLSHSPTLLLHPDPEKGMGAQWSPVWGDAVQGDFGGV